MIYLYGWNSVADFILDELEACGITVSGIIIDDDYLGRNIYPDNINIIPSSTMNYVKNNIEVINCLGYKNIDRRIMIGDRLDKFGVLKSFISKLSKIHKSTNIDTGAVILGDVVIEKGCKIGKHTLFWGGSRICHDSKIGNGVFLASGSIIGGECDVGDACSFGFNSSMREKSFMPHFTKVGANCFWRPSHE